MKKKNTQYTGYKAMRIFIYSLLLPTLAMGGWSCQNNKEDVLPEGIINNEEIYYYQNNEKQIISPNDTLSLKLKSTLTIYMDSINTPQIYAQAPIEIQENNNFSYDCYARELALSGVMMVWENNTKSMIFYINISPLYTYFYVGETNFIINVTDEALKDIIQEELITNYIPNYSAIKLSYNTLHDGDLTFVYKSEEIAEGSFRENGTNIDLLYKDHSNTIQYVGKNSENEYAITQDLTGIFKTQYSSENIQEVMVITTLLKVNS